MTYVPPRNDDDDDDDKKTAMQAYLDQASAILDSNSEEAWGETRKRPGEWE